MLSGRRGIVKDLGCQGNLVLEIGLEARQEAERTWWRAFHGGPIQAPLVSVSRGFCPDSNPLGTSRVED